MQITKPSDVSVKPIKVKKPAAHHLSRDLSIGKSSREIYYGDSSVAVPFRWESQPGTPIANFQQRSYRPVPPLTPPPSFMQSPAAANNNKKFRKKQSKANLFQGVLPKLSLKKTLQGQSSPGSLSSSNSSSSSSSPWQRTSRSVPSSPCNTTAAKARSTGGERFSSRARFEDDDDGSSGRPTLCFGIRRGSNVRTMDFSASLFKLMLDDAA